MNAELNHVELVAFHLTGDRSGGHLTDVAELDMRPALFAGYGDLTGLRYDYPLVLADNSGAFWLRHDGAAAIHCEVIPPGYSMFTAHDRNSPDSPRVRRHLPRFESTPPPAPERHDWQSWEKLLASKEKDENSDSAEGAICVVTDLGFGTVNASLIALPAASSHLYTKGFMPSRPDRCPKIPGGSGS